MQALAVTEIAAKNNSGSPWASLIWILLIVAVGAFFLTSRRRQRAAASQRQSTLQPGSHVITTAGLHATVVESDGSDVLLEVAPDVVLRFTRAAIARVLPPEAAPSDHEVIEASDEHDGEESGGPTETGSGGGPAPKKL